MKCNLERIIARLSLQFSVQVDGETFRSVTDLKPLAEGHSPRQDVLYVAACSELMQYNGPVVSGPVLCIAAGGRQTGYDRGAFSTVIWVNASSFSTVYLALGKILYEEGEYSSELSEAAERFLHCKSFEELVNVGYAYLENPFAVFDEDGNVIAYTKQAGLRDPNWSSDAFIRKAYNNENWNLHTQAMYEKARAASLPVREEAPDAAFPAMLRQPLDSRGRTVGVLVVTALFRPLTRRDEAVVQLLGQFMALDLLRQLSIRQSSVSDAGALKRYLETGELDEPGAQAWFQRQSAGAGENQYLLLINGGKTPAGVFLDVEQVMRDMAALLPGSVCTRLESGVVLYFSVEEPIAQNAPVLEPVDTYLQAHQLVAGLSNRFSHLSACRTALRQAASAIRYGSMLSPELALQSFADNALWQGLELISKKMDLRELMLPGLCEFLEDEDGEYRRTLEVYLLSGCRKSRTAEQLYVHLNTVKYRLTQISQRLGVDIDDPEVAFRLDLSLRIWRFLEHQDRTA